MTGGDASRLERRPAPHRRRPIQWRAILALVIILGIPAAVASWFLMIRMPGKGHQGQLPPLTMAEGALGKSLRVDVEKLATEIGERSVWKPGGLIAAGNYIAKAFSESLLPVARIPYRPRGHHCENIEATLTGNGRPEDIVLVGAHYDSVRGTVGANDNASGVAALIALARTFSGKPRRQTIRFVAFSNEEPPWFQTEDMGSLVYARACRARGDRITAMISLETIGYYADAEGSQDYPFPFGLFYPSRGDFITFVGNVGSAALVREAIATFRSTTPFPSEGGALPGWIPGVGWSDHWSFWKAGYSAIMVTDTAPFRYTHYHSKSDTPEKIDYERMARVVLGVERVIEGLAGR